MKSSKAERKFTSVKGIFPGLPLTQVMRPCGMLMIGWTSVAKREDAERIGRALVEQGLAACVQIEGPVQSIYRWEGKLEFAAEFRLVIKFIPARGRGLEAWLFAHHPYDTPEWCVVRAEQVAEKYLSWARANSTSAPL